MGEVEDFAVDLLVAEEEDVHIDHPWGVSLRHCDAAEAELDGLRGIQQIVGGARVVEGDDRVVEVRRARRAGNGFGLIDRCLVEAVGDGELLQEIACLLKVLEAIAEVRAQGDSHF